MNPRAPPLSRKSASFVEATLDALLPKPAGPEVRHLEAMRCAPMGKLRAFMCCRADWLLGVDRRAIGRVAAVVECLHAYSLAHDDLPAMDDDDMRRGKPSLHKAFDEARAILAGDGLLARALGLIASPEAHANPFMRCCETDRQTCRGRAWRGMVGGKMMDTFRWRSQTEIPEITRLAHEDGRAFHLLLRGGAVMGKASGPARQALSPYGQELDQAHQIADGSSISKGTLP